MNRVALIKHSAVGRHGGTRLFFRLAQELIAMGITVDIVVHDHDPEAAFPEMTEGLPIRSCRQVRYRGPRPLPLMLAEQELQSRALAAMIPAEADVLNVHEWRGLRAAALASGGRPIVWNCNDPSPWDIAAAEAAGLRQTVARLLVAVDRAYAVGHVARTLVLSEQARAIMHRAAGPRAFVVRCGVDTERGRRLPAKTAARRKLGIGDEVVALGIGVLVPRRRFEDLIEALALLAGTGVHALIVGTDQLDPGYASSLRRLVAERDLGGRIRFVTRAPTDAELWTYYAAADMFVFPNEQQTWGLAVTEAMAAGLPCIVSTGAGVHEVLSHGANALLVPPRSPNDLAAAIRRLADDPALRERIGSEASRWVGQNLTWRDFARTMVDHYSAAGSKTPMSSGSTTAP